MRGGPLTTDDTCPFFQQLFMTKTQIRTTVYKAENRNRFPWGRAIVFFLIGTVVLIVGIVTATEPR